jgi:hypothetical protein
VINRVTSGFVKGFVGCRPHDGRRGDFGGRRSKASKDGSRCRPCWCYSRKRRSSPTTKRRCSRTCAGICLYTYLVYRRAAYLSRRESVSVRCLGYQLSWVEVLLFTAAIVAMAEQVKVAKPGINNTTDVLLIGATAIIQILLFALAAAKVPILGIFNSTEFLLRTLIKLTQTAVAYQINAATLMRTISS